MKKILWVTFFLVVLLTLVTGITIFVMLSRNDIKKDSAFEARSELYLEISPQTDFSHIGEEGNEGENFLEKAEAVNPDTVGWMKIPGTSVDYPVVLSSDNEYYLYHNFEKEDSDYGVPFLDCRCSGDFSDFNSIIYGHNISGGKMFGEIENFKENEFFQNNPEGYLITPDKQYKIKFICSCVVESDSMAYQTVFLTENRKMEFLNYLEQTAVQSRDYDKKMDSRYIMLSTCSYEFENARTVLVGYLE